MTAPLKVYSDGLSPNVTMYYIVSKLLADHGHLSVYILQRSFRKAPWGTILHVRNSRLPSGSKIYSIASIAFWTADKQTLYWQTRVCIIFT